MLAIGMWLLRIMCFIALSLLILGLATICAAVLMSLLKTERRRQLSAITKILRMTRYSSLLRRILNQHYILLMTTVNLSSHLRMIIHVLSHLMLQDIRLPAQVLLLKVEKRIVGATKTVMQSI